MRRPRGSPLRDDARRDRSRQRDDRAEIQPEGELAANLSNPGASRSTIVRRELELRLTLADQVEPHVHRAVVAVGRGGARARQRDCALGDFGLRERAAPGDLFDGVAIQVARGEIHRREDARRILAQHVVDFADRLDKFAPVGRSQDAQAADAVGYGDLVGGLALAFCLHEPFNRLTFFRQALLDPGERKRQGRSMTLQTPRQLGDERTGRGRVGSRHVGEHKDQVSRIFFGDLGQPVCPVVRVVAVTLVGGDADGDAPQVLDAAPCGA